VKLQTGEEKVSVIEAFAALIHQAGLAQAKEFPPQE
jgi:hypothetical protein